MGILRQFRSVEDDTSGFSIVYAVWMQLMKLMRFHPCVGVRRIEIILNYVQITLRVRKKIENLLLETFLPTNFIFSIYRLQ